MMMHKDREDFKFQPADVAAWVGDSVAVGAADVAAKTTVSQIKQ